VAENDTNKNAKELPALNSSAGPEDPPEMTTADTPPGLESAAEIALEWFYSIPEVAGDGTKSRIDQIKESYALLRRFTPKELKILTNLKRNTSQKAWTLREDLVVLSLPLSNREIADILHDRNKEAVKKRLQLLRSKGLLKRQRES
jgi:hypothetical protein